MQFDLRLCAKGFNISVYRCLISIDISATISMIFCVRGTNREFLWSWFMRFGFQICLFMSLHWSRRGFQTPQFIEHQIEPIQSLYNLEVNLASLKGKLLCTNFYIWMNTLNAICGQSSLVLFQTVHKRTIWKSILVKSSNLKWEIS